MLALMCMLNLRLELRKLANYENQNALSLFSNIIVKLCLF